MSNLRFVRVLGHVSSGARVALDYFRRLCKKLGGTVQRSDTGISCVVPTEAIGSLDDYIDEFYSVVMDWRRQLQEPVELVFENRLLGGMSEATSITYDPKDDEFVIVAEVASEHGVEPTYVEDVVDTELVHEETIPMLGVTVEASGWVEQNSATDEFIGVGRAVARIPASKVRSKHVAVELKEAFHKVFSKATELAERAQEELIVPAREPGEW